MTKTMLRELGGEIRKQGGQGSGESLKDLVYDVETGEFVCVDKNLPAPSNCKIVTEMTREGFA